MTFEESVLAAAKLGGAARKTGRMVSGDGGRLVEQIVVTLPCVSIPTPLEGSRVLKAAIVYFIGPIDGPIKIGRTADLPRRLKTLSLANAAPLHVWAAVDRAPSVELEYHRRFSAHRLHGEWFARHPDILAEITALNAYKKEAE